MALERKAGFQSAIATDAADTAAGLLTPDRYNLAHTVAGATVGSIPYFPTATTEASSGMTWNANATAGEGLALAAGTATTDVNAYSGTQTWNNAAVTFTAFKQDITDSASNAASLLMDLKVGGTSKLTVVKDGTVNLTGYATNSFSTTYNVPLYRVGATGNPSGLGVSGTVTVTIVANSTGVMSFHSSNGALIKSTLPLAWSNAEVNGAGDCAIHRVGTNSLRFTSSTVSATTTSRTELNKAVASIADNTATATFTVTVPNAAHSAMLKVTLVGSLGAGGAVGANEATGTISYDFAIARTAGVATVATASTAYGSSTSAVAGAATITVSAAASAMTGANSATQTFTINVTIARGSGSSDNHTCLCYGRLLNANTSGITIA